MSTVYDEHFVHHIFMSSDVPGLRRQPSGRLEKQQPARLGQYISGVLLGISWHILWVITAHHSTFGTFFCHFLGLSWHELCDSLVIPCSSLRFLVAFRMPCLCAPSESWPLPHLYTDLYPINLDTALNFFLDGSKKSVWNAQNAWKHKNSACKAQTSKRETMDSTSLRYRMPSFKIRRNSTTVVWSNTVWSSTCQANINNHKQANQIGRTILIVSSPKAEDTDTRWLHGSQEYRKKYAKMRKVRKSWHFFKRSNEVVLGMFFKI